MAWHQNPDGSTWWSDEGGFIDSTGRVQSNPGNVPVPAGVGAATPAAPSAPTPSGGKSIDQMKAELQGANYPGPWDDASVVAAYNRTVGGGNAGGAQPGTQTGFNAGAASIAAQVAQNAAQQAYLNARLQMLEIPQFQAQSAAQIEQLAQQAARDAWNQKYQQATLDIQRGTFDWQKELGAAQLTGTYQGNPTLAAKQQEFEQALAIGGQTGYVQPTTTSTPGVNFTGASAKLVDAYLAGGRGGGMVAATLGVPLEQGQRLWDALQSWQDREFARTGDRPRASDAVVAQLATELGIGQPTAAAPGTGGAPQSTLARQQFETGATGYYNGQATLARQAQEQGTALQYLGMVNDLKKTNPFAYLQTLSSTPESIRGIVNTALQGLGYGGGIAQAAQASPTAGVPGAGVQGPGSMNYSTAGAPSAAVDPAPGTAPPPTMGPAGASVNTYNAAQATPRSGTPYSAAQALSAQYGTAGGGQPLGTAAPGEQMAPGRMNYMRQGAAVGQSPPPALPLGSQINAKDWLNAHPSVRNLALQGYDANNQNPDDVMFDFQRSLPQHAGATAARYRQPVYR